ncbi:MAG: 6-pyruvoyl-tetrahydropterin synthase-related protein [Candidatus Altiarchaeota archaeon]
MDFSELRRKVGLEGFSIILTFILVYFFMAVLMNLDPRWILSNTTTTGGDMGSHYILAQYLRDYLLPKGSVVGWYPGWQAGLPIFQYYFIPPYLLMVLLSFIIPLQVAFKLVTLMWVFMLPLTIYFGLRAMGFDSPTAGISISLSLCLLFLETVDGGNYSQWGGNIKSTLAGQFPYGISLALMVLSLGFLYKGYHDKKHLALNAVLFSLVALNHIYITMAIGLVSTFFLIDAFFSKKYDGILYLIKVFGLGFMLAGFWYIPMFFKVGWSSPPKDVFYGTPNMPWVFIPEYAVFYVFAVVGILFGVRERDKRVYFWVYSFVVVFAFLFLCQYTNLLYVRFLPFIYLIYLILATYGISRLTKGIEGRYLIPLIVAFVVVFWLSSAWVKDVPGWIKWNYEGLEGKSTWPTLKQIFAYMHDVNLSGRVDVEYGDYNYFGTPRVFEVMPMFTNKSVMEGLLFESSLTFPFFFYMQKTVSETSWWPGFPVRLPLKPDMSHGLRIFRLYNIQYFIASSKTIRNLLANNSDYRLEKTIKDPQGMVFEFYRVNEDSDYVEYSAREPVLVVTDDWKPFSFKWIDTPYLDVPLVYSDSLGDYELQHFKIIIMNKSVSHPTKEGVSFYTANQLEDALKASMELNTKECTTRSVLHEEELTANVSCINQPLLVKIPYFPNWQTSDAEKIYMSSPSLMLIFPEGNQVRVYYGTLLVDSVGWLSTVAGLLIVLYLALSAIKTKSKTKVKPPKTR